MVLLPGFAAGAPAVITAEDYSGFMRGNGVGWPHFSPADPDRVSVALVTGQACLEWTCEGILQSSPTLTAPWTDLPGAVSPCLVPPLQPAEFFRLRQRPAVHAGVGTGCPQQGFGFTGLPDSHWTNTPATRTECGWIVPQKWTGFANENDGRPFVRVVLRSFHQPPETYDWYYGNPAYNTPEDDADHQNDGWFHFRVRHPLTGPAHEDSLLRFEIAFDNPYRFPSGPLEVNNWWVTGDAWDWEDHDGRRIYTPMFRVRYASGTVGQWQHIAEENTFPDDDCIHDGRRYRCMFQQVIPATPAWNEVEVAQNLPYALEDRARLWRDLRQFTALHPDLGLRKAPLGFGGLASLPPEAGDPECHELYAIEIFRQVPDSNGQPDLPNDRIVIALAGLDYEPAGNWVAEGIALEILGNWAATGKNYRNAGSYVVIPVANPDGYEWPSTHSVPYGNGYATPDPSIHRGYVLFEPATKVPDSALDPEMLSLRNYIRHLDAAGIDGNGGSIEAFIDLQNDLCPHPKRWTDPSGWVALPPIFGFISYASEARRTKGLAFIESLRDPARSPHTCCYVRTPAVPEGWWPLGDQFAVYGIPLFLLFEFDAAALYSHQQTPPPWLLGGFATPITLPGMTGADPAYYVHGLLDQTGQHTSPTHDPAHLFRLFGSDIADSIREEFLPTLTP